MNDVKTTIHAGSTYYDEPIYNAMKPRADAVSEVRVSISKAFGSQVPQPIMELTGHDRVFLRWMKPDGKGGLTPCNRK